MKLEIWCKSESLLNLNGILARTVEWPVVPRIGDYIIVWDGWCCERVLDVHHSFDEGKCLIEIRSDTSGEYRKNNDRETRDV